MKNSTVTITVTIKTKMFISMSPYAVIFFMVIHFKFFKTVQLKIPYIKISYYEIIT